MAIQRQAENPGETLVIGEPIRYSIQSSRKKKVLPQQSTEQTQTIDVVRKDMIYTAIVFLAILGILAVLYFRLA